MSRPPIVAIDGPAGAGKSTAASQLAERLGFVLIDTGALYRAVALLGKERGIDWTDGPALGAMAEGLDLRFGAVEKGRPPLFVDGVDRSGEVRSPAISGGASQVSAHPEVRAALLGVQRRMGEGGGVVLEGRDIGSVVFPDAEVKVFLTASVDARARRRHSEYLDTEDLAGVRVPSFESVREGIVQRDKRDREREHAPLREAEDAVHLDTTGMDLSAVVDALARIVADAGK